MLVSFIVTAQPSGYTYTHPLPYNGYTYTYQSSPSSGKIDFVVEADSLNTNINFGVVLPGYSKNDVSVYWNSFSNSKTVAIFNAQFFNLTNGNLAFAVKANNQVLKEGGGVGENWTYKTFSRISNTGVSIFNGYSPTVFSLSKDYILGLHPILDNKSKDSYVARTFMGVTRKGPCSESTKDQCPVNKYLFFVDSGLTQSLMVKYIKEWGVFEGDIVMLDGSGSTQMANKNTSEFFHYFGEARKIPHTIMISEK